MRLDMIGVGVTDENPFRSGLRFMRVQPQAQLRQMQSSALKFNLQNGHRRKVNPKSETRNPKEIQ